MSNQNKKNQNSLPVYKDRLHTRGTRLNGRNTAFNNFLIKIIREVMAELNRIREELAVLRKEVNDLKHQCDCLQRSARHK